MCISIRRILSILICIYLKNLFLLLLLISRSARILGIYSFFCLYLDTLGLSIYVHIKRYIRERLNCLFLVGFYIVRPMRSFIGVKIEHLERGRGVFSTSTT